MARIAMLVWNDFRHDARVLKEAQTLVSAGHHVTVHALMAPGITPTEQQLAPGLSVRRLPRSPWEGALPGRTGALGLAWKVATRLLTHLRFGWRLARQPVDVVHAHDVNVLPTAWLAARLSGARIVYDAHEISTSREGYRSIRGLVAGIEKYLMPKVDARITTTTARARFFARAYGVARPLVLQNRPRLIPLPGRQCLREQLRLPCAWPIILYQGGLQRGRGLERLVVAMAQVPGAYLVIIGGGRLEPRLRQLAESPGLDGRVHFIPTVALAELPAYTAAADIGVQPILNTCLNHATTDSNKLFEYIMAGLPVVASDLPEIRAVLRRYQVGETVNPDLPEALGAALRRLVEQPELRRRYRDNALLARQHLNWENQEAGLVNLYAALLEDTLQCHP